MASRAIVARCMLVRAVEPDFMLFECSMPLLVVILDCAASSAAETAAADKAAHDKAAADKVRACGRIIGRCLNIAVPCLLRVSIRSP